jgi:hypothetical protein
MAITNYQQSTCMIASVNHVVGVAYAANPKHNTQQRQSVGFVNYMRCSNRCFLILQQVILLFTIICKATTGAI